MIEQFARRLQLKADRILLRGARGIVLLYHRVADEMSDPYGLCVSPADFEEHLRVMRSEGDPMALLDLAAGLRTGSLPHRAICVTFDDGYLDNLEHAEPLLQRYEVPATIFVTTGAAGRDREFWWDELERIFLQPGRLPASLELEISGQHRTWTLGHDTEYDRECQRRYRGWHLLDASAPTARHTAFREIYQLLQPLDSEVRTGVVDELLSWAGQTSSMVRASHRTMTPGQVSALASGGLVEIGAHTVTHPALPTLTAPEQRVEIEHSKRELEHWTGREVLGFAYPYGLYDESAVIAARSAGFAYACSGICEPVWRASDLFLFPRIEVTHRDREPFARRLRRYFQ